jgi:hypothetical protein
MIGGGWSRMQSAPTAGGGHESEKLWEGIASPI